MCRLVYKSFRKRSLCSPQRRQDTEIQVGSCESVALIHVQSTVIKFGELGTHRKCGQRFASWRAAIEQLD